MPTLGRIDSTIEADIARLRVRDAGPERVARIRAECLAALARTRQTRAGQRPVSAQWGGRAEAVVVTALAALFLAAAVERALQILP